MKLFLCDLLVIVGVGLCGWGLYLVHPPSAAIVLGAITATGGVMGRLR